jgi:hypothetical protein
LDWVNFVTACIPGFNNKFGLAISILINSSLESRLISD